jgi:hypothetical protein
LLDFLAGKAQTLVSTSKRSIADRYRYRARTIFVSAGQIAEDKDLQRGTDPDWGQPEPGLALANSAMPIQAPTAQPVAQAADQVVETHAPPEKDSLDWLRQTEAGMAADEADRQQAPF